VTIFGAAIRGGVMRLLGELVLVLAIVLCAIARSATGDDAFVLRAEKHLASLDAFAANLPNSPAERGVFDDAADGRWDQFDLLSAALLAERGSADGRERSAKILEQHVARLRQLLRMENNQRYAATLFHYLHEHVLTGKFDARCHAIERTLQTGDYNCLTGVVLFVGLADRCGISAKAMLAPSHVYARANVGGVWLDVETTSPSWFRESAARQRQLLAAVLGDFSGAKTPRELDSVTLLAVVYYNRGVAAFEERNFAAAAASNLCALRLDAKNTAAADNLLAAVNNWALQAAKRGDAKTTAMLLDRGRRVAPERADFKATAKFVAGK
jgi:hypothetical protein